MIELPELPPDPAGTCEVDCGPGANGSRFVRYEDGYSADQMTAYARQAVAAAMERAAQIADAIAHKHQQDDGTYPAGKKAGAFEVAAAIRAEMSKDHPQ